MKTLIYTIAIDAPGEYSHQTMAKLLAASLGLNGFSGDILILTNSKERLFGNDRGNICQVSVDARAGPHISIGASAKTFKFRSRDYVDVKNYAEIMFVDCDCLFLQDPVGLLYGNHDISYAEEPWSNITSDWHCGYLTDSEMAVLRRPAINSGVWCVQAEHFQDLMYKWETVKTRSKYRRSSGIDQSAWVRVLLDTTLQALPFSPSAVRFPFLEKLSTADRKAATLLHLAFPCTPVLKLDYMLAVYTEAYGSEAAADVVDVTALGVKDLGEITRRVVKSRNWRRDQVQRGHR